MCFIYFLLESTQPPLDLVVALVRSQPHISPACAFSMVLQTKQSFAATTTIAINTSHISQPYIVYCIVTTTNTPTIIIIITIPRKKRSHHDVQEWCSRAAIQSRCGSLHSTIARLVPLLLLLLLLLCLHSCT